MQDYNVYFLNEPGHQLPVFDFDQAELALDKRILKHLFKDQTHFSKQLDYFKRQYGTNPKTFVEEALKLPGFIFNDHGRLKLESLARIKQPTKNIEEVSSYLLVTHFPDKPVNLSVVSNHSQTEKLARDINKQFDLKPVFKGFAEYGITPKDTARPSKAVPLPSNKVLPKRKPIKKLKSKKPIKQKSIKRRQTPKKSVQLNAPTDRQKYIFTQAFRATCFTFFLLGLVFIPKTMNYQYQSYGDMFNSGNYQSGRSLTGSILHSSSNNLVSQSDGPSLLEVISNHESTEPSVELSSSTPRSYFEYLQEENISIMDMFSSDSETHLAIFDRESMRMPTLFADDMSINSDWSIRDLEPNFINQMAKWQESGVDWGAIEINTNNFWLNFNSNLQSSLSAKGVDLLLSKEDKQSLFYNEVLNKYLEQDHSVDLASLPDQDQSNHFSQWLQQLVNQQHPEFKRELADYGVFDVESQSIDVGAAEQIYQQALENKDLLSGNK